MLAPWNPQTDYEPLVVVGMVGWVMLFVGQPLVRGQMGLAFFHLLLSIAIVDFWAVVPASLHQDHHDSSEAVRNAWLLALAPWAWMGLLLAHWVLRHVTRDREISA